MKSNTEKELLIKRLKQTPIVQLACEKTGISRAAYYRWRKEDEVFKKASNEALREGVGYINDLAESQLVNLIKDRKFQAIQYWLSHRNKKYNPRIKISGDIEVNRKLSDEEKGLIKEALRLAGVADEKI